MADKASRGLVVYGDGLMPLISGSDTPHLHSLASKASCGFLSLPHSPPSESEVERVVRELAQLFDAHDDYVTWKEKVDINSNLECQKELLVRSLSERFMGMRAAIFTTSSCVRSFARDLGFHVLQFDQLIKNNHSMNEPPQEVPDGFYMASELLRFLGFQEGEVSEASEFDLVFVHIGAGKANDLKDKVTGFELEWVNALIGGVMQIAQPCSEVGSRLHFSLVMSYGTVSESENHSSSILVSQMETNSFFSMLRPSQSFTMKGGSLLKNIRHHSPMLIAQWQEAVTRRDMAETFSFKEFVEYGANLAIPADRFLHEVAFKLWKAPKYGA